MKIEIEADTLRISDVVEMRSDTSRELRRQVRAAMADGLRNIEIDLAQTAFIDSAGLGALVALESAAEKRRGTLRVVNPRPAVRQILELARMEEVGVRCQTPVSEAAVVQV